ncbi:MAG: alpha/beta fold hydrolase [Actinomycetota bacterium]
MSDVPPETQHDVPLWEQRFRAPKLSLPRWSHEAPDRTVYETNESGVWQVHTFDVASGETRQISDHPVGVLTGYPTLDGSGVVFWQEDTGDETGRWLLQPFEGGGDEPFLEGIQVGWDEGMAQAPGIVAAGISDRDGFAVYVSEHGAPVKEIARSAEWLGLAGNTSETGGVELAAFSADGTLLALQHAEHGDITHPSVRIVDPRTGGVVGERGDGSSAVLATTWAPIAGDQRVAISHELADRLGVGLWDLADGSWIDLDPGLPGDVEAIDWWPDASALLLVHAFEARTELYRYDVASATATKLDTPPGTVQEARVRPDGTVWFRHTDGERRSRVLDDRGGKPIALAQPAPPGRPFQEWRYPNEHGQTVQGWVVEPDGPGPHPVMIYVHGGPHWLYEDRYMPEIQAYVDAGFLVAMPNYRGSTGYGRAWRDALTGDPGFTDVDDVTAGLRDILDRTDADASRTVIAGWSWGGYITLMQLGRNPDLWTVGMAGVPVGDYEMAYTEEAPSLQAMDRALFGGTPEEKPDLYRRSNPVTYADDVKAPVLFVLGDNDSRCPLGQALAYVARLEDRGAPHEVYRYTTGHGSNDTDEDVRQQRVILDFLARQLPGLREI